MIYRDVAKLDLDVAQMMGWDETHFAKTSAQASIPRDFNELAGPPHYGVGIMYKQVQHADLVLFSGLGVYHFVNSPASFRR